VYDTGGTRRTHLRGRDNILKRLLIHAAAFNIALLVCKLHGIGTLRMLQKVSPELLNSLLNLGIALVRLYAAVLTQHADWDTPDGVAAQTQYYVRSVTSCENGPSTTGC
jgi:transposase